MHPYMYMLIGPSNLNENAVYLYYFLMDENDALSEYNKIPLGHNRTNGAVYSKIYFMLRSALHIRFP